MSDTNKQPLWKQLLGAVIGGSLALSLYYGYEFAKPKVEAILTLPPAERIYDLGDSNIADKTTDEGNRKRLLSRNLRVAQGMEESAHFGNEEALHAADDHSTDIAWPGHNPDDPKYTEVTGIVPETEEEMAMEDITEEDMALVAQHILEQQMATKEMAANNWDTLWGDIRDRDNNEYMEHTDAEALPDTGFGIGALMAGAAGSAFAMRKRKRKMN